MPLLKDLRYHRPSSAPPQTQCQKCLAFGHFTYECQRPRTYLYRPSRTQRIKHNKPSITTTLLDPTTIPGNNPVTSLPSSVNVADVILEEKEKQRRKLKQKLPLPSMKRTDSDSDASSTSSLRRGTTSTSEDSDSDDSRDETSDPDTDPRSDPHAFDPDLDSTSSVSTTSSPRSLPNSKRSLPSSSTMSRSKKRKNEP
ncbi:hypothetical protein HMI54_001096 [Coelomomyces lativittatus]|nr:hypothetical protein HMI56_000189 [Coelomomyces lativittatus]KAJ1510633.1 hypothetical protein HMI55_006921 [Coelomomyces lativittatus]KAJ1511037.1 hypothetical protein HMI54_001096 [Coelomomyces lativittatus]